MRIFEQDKRSGKHHEREKNCQRRKSEKRCNDEADQAKGRDSRAGAGAKARRKIPDVIVSVSPSYDRE